MRTLARLAMPALALLALQARAEEAYVHMSPPSVSKGLSPFEVRRFLAAPARIEPIRDCYAAARRADPTLDGTLTVRVNILDGRGLVDVVVLSPRQSPALEECVRKALAFFPWAEPVGTRSGRVALSYVVAPVAPPLPPEAVRAGPVPVPNPPVPAAPGAGR